MATINTINVSVANDNNGDTLRNAFVKTNDNFAELNSKKVEAELGKGLSENDFTDADKNKLDSIEAGAAVQVQSDWGQTNPLEKSYIPNKPIISTSLTEVMPGKIADATSVKVLKDKQDEGVLVENLSGTQSKRVLLGKKIKFSGATVQANGDDAEVTIIMPSDKATYYVNSSATLGTGVVGDRTKPFTNLDEAFNNAITAGYNTNRQVEIIFTANGTYTITQNYCKNGADNDFIGVAREFSHLTFISTGYNIIVDLKKAMYISYLKWHQNAGSYFKISYTSSYTSTTTQGSILHLLSFDIVGTIEINTSSSVSFNSPVCYLGSQLNSSILNIRVLNTTGITNVGMIVLGSPSNIVTARVSYNFSLDIQSTTDQGLFSTRDSLNEINFYSINVSGANININLFSYTYTPNESYTVNYYGNITNNATGNSYIRVTGGSTQGGDNKVTYNFNNITIKNGGIGTNIGNAGTTIFTGVVRFLYTLDFALGSYFIDFGISGQSEDFRVVFSNFTAEFEQSGYSETSPIALFRYSRNLNNRLNTFLKFRNTTFINKLTATPYFLELPSNQVGALPVSSPFVIFEGNNNLIGLSTTSVVRYNGTLDFAGQNVIEKQGGSIVSSASSFASYSSTGSNLSLTIKPTF